MTNEEAIKALELINLNRVHPFLSWEEMMEVRDKAIEALKKQEQLEKKEQAYYGTFANSNGVGDRLVLGVDIDNKDRSTIVVGRNVNGSRYETINQLWDKEAEEIYYTLVGI